MQNSDSDQTPQRVPHTNNTSQTAREMLEREAVMETLCKQCETEKDERMPVDESLILSADLTSPSPTSFPPSPHLGSSLSVCILKFLPARKGLAEAWKAILPVMVQIASLIAQTLQVPWSG